MIGRTMGKNWTGNKKSLFVTLGATGHSSYEREEYDFYATSPKAVELFYKHWWDRLGLGNKIWEPAVGNGHIAETLKHLIDGIELRVSDIVVRDYPCEQLDFLMSGDKVHEYDIVTNPPYKYAREFVEHAISLIDTGHFVVMLLKLTFLEGQARYHMFAKHPPKWVIVHSSRVQVALGGDPKMFDKSSAAAYAWFVWQKGYKDAPRVGWIP